MTAPLRAASAIVDQMKQALLDHALPGELDGFGGAEQDEAAAFVASVAGKRKPGELAIRLESTGGEAGRRRMRLALINDDMPFLVDSVAAAIGAKCLTIHRLLHPIVHVTRDDGGDLLDAKGGTAESIIYIELDRADARGRQDLLAELTDVLSDVRAAVVDWRDMTARMEADATAIATSDSEGAALLHWLAQNNFTLLGHAVVANDATVREGLGILRRSLNLWDDSATLAAIDELVSKRRSLLLLKADRISPVHRRVPLDVVMVACPDGTLSIHTGLWTSAALRAPAEEVPILRQRLTALDRELGFAPSSHAGKALAHAISTLPHDLLISLDPAEVREAATTAMSLADRPRPTLLLLPLSLIHI